MHANIKLFDAVSKTAVISLVSINLTQILLKYVQLELLHHHIKVYPNHMKSVRENEANRLCFALTLWQTDEHDSLQRSIRYSYGSKCFNKKKEIYLIFLLFIWFVCVRSETFILLDFGSFCRCLTHWKTNTAFICKCGGRNSSLVVFGLPVHSVTGSIILWGNFSVEGIFPLELTWVQTPFPQKLFRMRV